MSEFLCTRLSWCAPPRLLPRWYFQVAFPVSWRLAVFNLGWACEEVWYVWYLAPVLLALALAARHSLVVGVVINALRNSPAVAPVFQARVLVCVLAWPGEGVLCSGSRLRVAGELVMARTLWSCCCRLAACVVLCF